MRQQCSVLLVLASWAGGATLALPAAGYFGVDQFYPGGWFGNKKGKGLIWDSIQYEVDRDIERQKRGFYRPYGGGQL